MAQSRADVPDHWKKQARGGEGERLVYQALEKVVQSKTPSLMWNGYNPQSLATITSKPVPKGELDFLVIDKKSSSLLQFEVKAYGGEKINQKQLCDRFTSSKKQLGFGKTLFQDISV